MVTLINHHVRHSPYHLFRELFEGLKKAENEETHFSTNQDEVISWKKIETIEHCKLYEVSKRQPSSMANIYHQIFMYHKKKLVKTFQTKKGAICGVIELK
jgi:hypothetical protein